MLMLSLSHPSNAFPPPTSHHSAESHLLIMDPPLNPHPTSASSCRFGMHILMTVMTPRHSTRHPYRLIPSVMF